MIVVDSSVIAYLLLPSRIHRGSGSLAGARPGVGGAGAVAQRVPQHPGELLRRGLLTFEQACGVQREAEDLLAGAEHEVDSDSVLALARDSDCSAYDCEFVVLARRVGVLLVTMDKKLLKAFPSSALALALPSEGRS